MKKIYLVQRMERDAFRYHARKGVKVGRLDCYGHVMTMWYDSKQKAINHCRKLNRVQNFVIYFVRRIYDYTK